MVLSAPPKQGSSVMKTNLSALIALSILAGVAAPTNAARDTKAFDRIHQFGVYDRCMVKPRDTPCLGINVAQKRAGQSSTG
jgi:hypothetical protein